MATTKCEWEMSTIYGEKKKKVVIQDPTEEEILQNAKNVEKVVMKVEFLSLGHGLDSTLVGKKKKKKESF